MSTPNPDSLASRCGTFLSRLWVRVGAVDRVTLVTAAVAVLSGIGVFVVASTVFAYHSTNHDEAVYLMQAAMLLEGQLELFAGDLVGAFRPWFFVEDGGHLYSKYTPVPAAMYAVSMALFGEPRVTLAVVAACNTALVAVLGSMLFDRRVGAVAAVFFALSPLALVTSSVFLPYAPTTFLNLVFAVAYLRSVRDRSLPAAGVAGLAIGLAFFARPFTAVLFAAPFIAHALYRVTTAVWRSWGRAPLGGVPDPLARHGLTALLGVAFVGVTLAYNLRLTGDPLLFPYEAFAPLDGPGFGRREILGHSIVYTPEVALRANGYVLWYLATRWYTAGPLGTGLALAGLGVACWRWSRGRLAVTGDRRPDDSLQRTGGLLLAGLFVTVIAGNVFFWGSFNVLATMTDPSNGIISKFGPIYHFDLLVPLSVFAGVAVVACWRLVPAVRQTLSRRLSMRTARTLVAVALAVSVLLVGTATVAAVSTPIERNAAVADKYEVAYEPIDETEFENALVFIPTPYGDWQNHPFQYLRNDPGLDGPVVYALDRGPEETLAVVDAYPDRTYYRYAYQGEWSPDPNRHVVPKLEPLEVVRGESVTVETTVGIPERVERARVGLETDHGSARYTVTDPDESLTVDWSMDRDAVRFEGFEEGSSARLRNSHEAVVTVTLVQPDGSTLTYRQEATLRTTTDGVEVVWPPERQVCTLVTECGTEGTYIPDDPDAHLDGVFFETEVTSHD